MPLVPCGDSEIQTPSTLQLYHLHLPCLHQSSRRIKNVDDYMWEVSYGPSLEVAHVILTTVHRLAHRHMATPHCEEGWKMLSISTFRKKERVWQAATTNTCTVSNCVTHQ